MRKVIFSALVVLCAAWANPACVQAANQVFEMSMEAPEGNFVEDLLKAAAAESCYCYAELQAMYDAGTATIEKEAEGVYVVRVVEADGGIWEISIEDSF